MALLFVLGMGLHFGAGCLLEERHLETVIAALLLGAVYGLMIEFFTSVVFGARPIRSTVAISAARKSPKRGHARQGYVRLEQRSRSGGARRPDGGARPGTSRHCGVITDIGR